MRASPPPRALRRGRKEAGAEPWEPESRRSPPAAQPGSALRADGQRPRTPRPRSLLSDSVWAAGWEERAGALSRESARGTVGKQLSSVWGTASALSLWRKLGLGALKAGRGHCQEMRDWSVSYCFLPARLSRWFVSHPSSPRGPAHKHTRFFLGRLSELRSDAAGRLLTPPPLFPRASQHF